MAELSAGDGSPSRCSRSASAPRSPRPAERAFVVIFGSALGPAVMNLPAGRARPLKLAAEPGRRARDWVVREERLPGGNVSGAVRVGDTVRRQAGPWTPAVHALLRHLEERGFDAAPRVVGIDDRGREMLSYIEGETVGVDAPWPAWWRANDTLVQAVTLLRRFHDAAASFEPPPDARWRFEGRTRPGATIVHGDWAPYNVVWREGRVVGVIDWDLARPGDALDDLAFVAWHWAPLHHPGMLDGGELGRWRRADRERRLRLVLDSYGLDDREGFIARVIARISASADGIESAADAGDVGMIGLRRVGVVEDVRRSATWVGDHQAALTAAVGARPSAGSM